MPVRIIGPKDTKEDSAINVTTSSKSWSRGLSPMLIGPVNLYNNYISLNVENSWQYSKVYKDFVDESNCPNEKYWRWAKNGWNKVWADRYPMGKNIVPLYSFWNGEYLDYIEARKQIYIPVYSEAVLKTEAWKLLQEKYKQNNENIILFDYDGYDYLKLGMTLNDVLHDPTRKMGHAFVLAMLLEKTSAQ